jgi:hypothetical protein
MPYAAHLQPGFTAQDYSTSLATEKDFASGKSADAVKAANQAVLHAQSVLDQIPGLGNYTYLKGIANPIHQMVSGQMDPSYQFNLSQFRSSVNGLSGELAKSFRGDRTAEQDVQNWRQSMNELDSPEGIKGGLMGGMKLLDGALTSLASRYNDGKKSNRDPYDFIYPKNRPILDKIMGRDSTEGTASEGAAAPPVQTPQGTPPEFGSPVAPTPSAPAAAKGTFEAPIPLEDSEAGRAAAMKLPKGTWVQIPGRVPGQIMGGQSGGQ